MKKVERPSPKKIRKAFGEHLSETSVEELIRLNAFKE
jgi:hypothetical protein